MSGTDEGQCLELGRGLQRHWRGLRDDEEKGEYGEEARSW